MWARDGIGDRQGYYQGSFLGAAIFEDHVAAMLGDYLLRERNSDSSIEGGFAVEWKEKLIFIERFGIEIKSIYLNGHVTMVDSGGNAEFTTSLNTLQYSSNDGTEALLDEMPVQFYLRHPAV